MRTVPRLKGILLTLLLLLFGVGIGLANQQAEALDMEEISNIQIYEKAAPAVVTITVATAEGPSSGAGVIIDPSGIILTSSHVVASATAAKITLESGEEYKARILARIGQKSDLAILRAETGGRNLPSLHMGDSQSLRVGQKVLAIGNPYGFDRTLTIGIISRLDKQRNRIQTDASINPGNSGGPLLNTSGEIIGINQSIFNPDGRRTNIGIGFAVPIDTAKAFIREIAMLPNPRPRHQIAEVSREISQEGFSPSENQDIPILLQEFSRFFNPNEQSD